MQTRGREEPKTLATTGDFNWEFSLPGSKRYGCCFSWLSPWQREREEGWGERKDKEG